MIKNTRKLLLKKGVKQHFVPDSNNLNKLLYNETRKEYQIDVANRFPALEALGISSVYDTRVKIRESMKAFAKEKLEILETHRNETWFNQKCSELANKRK